MAKKETKATSITEDSVLDVTSYNEDFAAIDEQGAFVDDLYDELHGKVKAASDSSGKAGVLGGIKPNHINSQAYEVLMKIRTSRIDLVGKRTNLKLSLAGLAQKNRATREDMGGDQAELARELIKQLQKEKDVQTNRERIGRNDYGQKSSGNDLGSLDARVESELSSGGIVLTPNEKAMKYAKDISTGNFSYVYDEQNEKIQVKLGNGTIIPPDEWPDERLPQSKIIDSTDDFILLEDGKKIPKI